MFPRARVEQTIAFFTHLVAELDPESVALLNDYTKNKEKNIKDLVADPEGPHTSFLRCTSKLVLL